MSLQGHSSALSEDVTQHPDGWLEEALEEVLDEQVRITATLSQVQAEAQSGEKRKRCVWKAERANICVSEQRSSLASVLKLIVPKGSSSV